MALWKNLGRKRWVQVGVGVAAAEYLRFVALTNRLILEPADIYERLEPELPVIFAMWHGQQAMVPFVRRPEHRAKALISRHRDGELNAVALQWLGVEGIRGSGDHGGEFHRKGGVPAFRQMLTALENGHSMVLTADVPKVSRVCGLGIVTLVVVVIGSWFREEKQLAATWKRVLDEHHLGAHHFRDDLVDSGAFEVTRSTADGCDGTLGKDAMAGCTQADARPRKSMVFRAPYLYRCLHVQVPANGTLDIELDVRETDDLVGFFVRDAQHFEGLSIQLPGPGVPIVPAQRQRRHPFQVTASARGDASTIHLRNEAIRAQGLCFVLAAAEAP